MILIVIIGCCDHIALSFDTSTEDLKSWSHGIIDHGVKKHIGIYRKTTEIFDGQYTYKRDGEGFTSSYLFYVEEYGWRV